ncbi:type II secretion system protein [Colwellia psychrerythraea]|uniref:MSHA biogenesis protein MshA n=1 Tax=Colwellia psychrerythraea TaxID=28229 RepID=A0A099KNL7_COLPS|nr:type II secretion system protein [Colwellia psychrerythraea]KGJ92364.1 hypothetical protein GAB14E_0486 [Colwellia psychrerythraea]
MKNKGFTLIELVVVIVILGILAVTAVPKFINLKAEAQTSTLQGIQAAMQSSSALVYGKSIVKGNHKEPFSLDNTVNIGDTIGGGELLVVYGYPIGVFSQFQRLLELDSVGDDSTYRYTTIGTNFTTFVINFRKDVVPTSINDDCIVVYTSADDVGLSPTFKVNDCV